MNIDFIIKICNKCFVNCTMELIHILLQSVDGLEHTFYDTILRKFPSAHVLVIIQTKSAEPAYGLLILEGGVSSSLLQWYEIVSWQVS